MKQINSQKALAAFVLGATALLGSGVPTYAQASQQQIERKRAKIQQRQIQVQEKRGARQQNQAAPRQVQIPQPRVELNPRRQVQIEQQRQDQVEQQRQRQARTERQQVQVQPRQPQVERQRQIELQNRQQELANRQQRQDLRERRLSTQQQRQQIELQQRRLSVYNQRLENQRRLAEQRAEFLRNQRRLAQYRYQQEYLRRLYEQQRAISAYRSYNYYNDPFYYTAPNWRYVRGGRSYYVNQYAADLLRQAVNYGYQEGYNAGLADREDRWGFGYRDSFAWQDANFGFNGLYVDQSEYNYYFREGFRRGYEDSYYGRSQYGNFVSGKGAIIGAAVIAGILGLAALAD